MLVRDNKLDKSSPSLKFIAFCIIPLFMVAVISTKAVCQEVQTASFASKAEKVYLQLDNKVYTLNQIIWFKAIVATAGDHFPSELSGVLYVELINPFSKLVEKKVVKIDQGVGEGFFQLSETYPGGVYMIRAYTEWNRNFGADFLYQEYIQVFPTSSKAGAKPLRNIALIKDQNEQRSLNAVIEPFVFDSLDTRELSLIISMKETTDTLSIKKNRENRYQFDYGIPAGCRAVTLQIYNKDQFYYAKTIIVDKDYPDLQFFPESGELVHGISSSVGFKAVSANGKGKMVEGEIINRKGDVIAFFKSNPLGMGSFILHNADSSEQYTARIFSTSNERLQATYPLPAVASKGNVLSAQKDGDRIRLNAISNYLMNDSVVVRVSCRGIVYYDVKGKLNRGSLLFTLAANTLPEGIIDFTLMNAAKHPVAERLYFNSRPESRINISVTADKPGYSQREATSLTIETKGADAHPLYSSVSLLVIDKSMQASLDVRRQSILAYFLLNSDLRGEIENPDFYFNKIDDRHHDLDALMLTQGWRKYKYQREPVQIVFKPEANLSVSGIVKGSLFNRNAKKGTGLTMMTFGDRPTVQSQVADSTGRFNFLVDEYGDDIKVLIQTTGKTGANKNYTVVLDKKESPPIFFDHAESAVEPDSITELYVKKVIEQKEAGDAYTAATEGVTLQEVVVKSYVMTPERKLVTDKYGKPKTVIEGDAIRKKEAKWSYGLYSVLLFNFPDKVRVERYGDGTLYASLFNKELTLVVVDGIPVKARDYSFIPALAPSEVKSFELIEYARNFSSLYCEVIPENCGVNAPMTGNVIAIYTYARKGLFGASPPVGIMKTTIQAFSTPREFYAPKYEQLKPGDWLKPDLRTLIHWQAKVAMDSRGKGTVVFYNGDNTGTMQAIVEAISPDGRIGYHEIFYEVGK